MKLPQPIKTVFLIISGIILLSCHLTSCLECLLQVLFPMSIAPLTLCLFRELLKHLSSIHIAARTAIDDDYLFYFLLCFNLFDYSAWIADSYHI